MCRTQEIFGRLAMHIDVYIGRLGHPLKRVEEKRTACLQL